MTATEGDSAGLAIRQASLFCETCGQETRHRILRVDRRSAGSTTISGIARCQECRITHPFVSAPERTASLEVIVSEGPKSTRLPLVLPASRLLRRGETIDAGGRPALVTRLELARGGTSEVAPVREVATVWGTRALEPTFRLAIIEGDRSRTVRLPASALPRIEVGASFRLGGSALVVTALRARGRTWRRPGDVFAAEEASVVYARRTERPPAGRRRWSSERGMPRSRASSTSTRARSRSSPGVNRARTAPRTRTAEGGATVHRSSSS